MCRRRCATRPSSPGSRFSRSRPEPRDVHNKARVKVGENLPREVVDLLRAAEFHAVHVDERRCH